MRFCSIIFLIFAVSVIVAAQETDTGKILRAVTNEDQGEAFLIVKDDFKNLFNSSDKLNSEPKQMTIFLGKGWQSESLQNQKNKLSNLLSESTGNQKVYLTEKLGISNFSGENAYRENLFDFGKDREINDLKIQNILEKELDENPLQIFDKNTVFVIFLEPEVSAKMRGLISGKHFLAYFNSFNAADKTINYAVVPYAKDQKFLSRIALSVFFTAAEKINRRQKQDK